MEGNSKKATDEYITLLLKTVDQDPSDLGYDLGRWTAQRLATYLENHTGIKLSSSQVRRILTQKSGATLRLLKPLRNAHQEKVRLPLGKV